MIRRLLGAALPALMLVLALVAVLPAAVLAAEAAPGEEAGVEGEAPLTGEEPAVEADEGPLTIEQIGTDVARSEGFFPDEYVSPSWFQWVLYPTIIIGVVMTFGLLLYYLFRQPSFAAERREKSRK